MEVAERGATQVRDLTALFDERPSAAAVAAVCGEAWVGKSKLLDRAAALAASRGWPVLRARADPGRDAPAGQLFRDAFDDLLTERGPAVLNAVAPVHRPVLARAFAPAGHPDAGEGAAEFRSAESSAGWIRRVGPAVRELMTAIAGSAGLLVALDDGHWADRASTELLGYLLRRPPAGRVLVLFAYRERQCPPRVLGMLAAASAVGTLQRIDVKPLSARELVAMLPDGLPEAQQRSLVTRAAGNPGLLLALLACERASTDAPASPSSSRFAAFLGELRALSEDGWLVAQAAAVLGGSFAPGEAHRIAGVTEARFRAAFGELVREDVVQCVGVFGVYRFRSPWLRAAVYRSADEGWLLKAHSLMICARREQTSRLHLAAVFADPAAGLPFGADGRPGEQPWDEESLDDWRLRVGRDLVIAGRLEEGLDFLENALRPGACATAAQYAEAAEWRSRAQRALGRHAMAESQLATALARPSVDPAATVRMQLARLAVVIERGHLPSLADRATLCAVAGLSDPPIRTRALALLGICEADRGWVARAVEHLDQATDVIDDLPDEQLHGCLDALYWLGMSWARLEYDQQAARLFERGLRLAHDHQLDYLVPQFCSGLSRVLLRSGLVARATDAAWQAVRYAEQAGSDYLAAPALAALARCARAAGDGSTAAEAVGRALGCAAGSREPWADRVRLTALDVGLDAGDLSPFDDAAIAGIARRVSTFPDLTDLTDIGEMLTRVALARGGLDEPQRWVEVAERSAARMRLPGATGLALLARAHHRLGEDPLASAAFALSAVVMLTLSGRLLDAARAHLAVAAAWTAIADHTAACREVASARALLDRCGAHRYLDQLDLRTADGTRGTAETTACGPHPPSGVAVESAASAAPAPAPEGAGRLAVLSHREREIALLVSGGYTNQQIAHALTLSHKTVETYLGRIFKKLDVNSRVLVATAVERGGAR